MLKPKGSPHFPAPLRVTARTCAYSEYGWPVIHGSEARTDTAGVFKPFADQTMLFSVKRWLVESSNW